MTRTMIAVALLSLNLLAIGMEDARAQGTSDPIDYGDGKNWLCRPGRQDACAVDLTTTVVAANGKLKKEKWRANVAAPIDCFYVYPTVSLDTTPNSDMNAGPEEHNVIASQFARFGALCRTFAPLYRQITLTALRTVMAGRPLTADRLLGYHDVLNAWNHYLAHDNQGRGIVLIGHSQGSSVLTELIRNEIDGKPIQNKIVSALLIGTNLAVPKGKDVGGAFQHLPLCRSQAQIGCVIAYASFRSTMPPPANSLFGRVPGENMEAACTNPANLAGGRGELHAYLSNRARAEGIIPPWVQNRTITTPFVSVPGLLSAQCVSNDKGSYLEVTVHGDPNDPRTDDIGGDVITGDQVQANWGLHLIDVNLAMGNLLKIVKAQTKTYLAQKQ